MQNLVDAHGTDTLSFFKLRNDIDHLFAPGGCAVAGYRVEAGVLMVAADLVGPADQLSGLATQLRAEATRRGLKLAVFAASQAGAELFAPLGLRPLYLGDEAIVSPSEFSLEGRPIRKVRQSVTRLEREGYSTEFVRLGDLTRTQVDELQALADRARDGAPEHGFAMELPSLQGRGLDRTWVLVARDTRGAARGVLHLVGCGPRPALSLSLTRRERRAPNGLVEFMVVRAILAARERGVEEISLNFATFGRWIAAPTGPAERALGRVARAGDRWFQIESLYRFNAKFFPRWEPRYLLHEGPRSLPRTALAAMWAEGLLPKPRPRS
ncbi:MAG: phosphatidylglycerol lysyltransferase domain-containing protein [Solirubrobacteraceae bacterium]